MSYETEKDRYSDTMEDKHTKMVTRSTIWQVEHSNQRWGISPQQNGSLVQFQSQPASSGRLVLFDSCDWPDPFPASSPSYLPTAYADESVQPLQECNDSLSRTERSGGHVDFVSVGTNCWADLPSQRVADQLLERESPESFNIGMAGGGGHVNSSVGGTFDFDEQCFGDEILSSQRAQKSPHQYQLGSRPENQDEPAGVQWIEELDFQRLLEPGSFEELPDKLVSKDSTSTLATELGQLSEVEELANERWSLEDAQFSPGFQQLPWSLSPRPQPFSGSVPGLEDPSGAGALQYPSEAVASPAQCRKRQCNSLAAFEERPANLTARLAALVRPHAKHVSAGSSHGPRVIISKRQQARRLAAAAVRGSSSSLEENSICSTPCPARQSPEESGQRDLVPLARQVGPSGDVQILAAALKGAQYGRKQTPKFVLHNRLLSFAEAVATNEMDRVEFLLGLLQQDSSPVGDDLQRITHYVVEGLRLRIAGPATRGMIQYANTISDTECFDKAASIDAFDEKFPFADVCNVVAFGSVLEAVAGEEKIHIISFVRGCSQWWAFLKELAQQPGQMPRVRFTCVTFVSATEQYSGLERYECRQMEEVATQLGIHLTIHYVQTDGQGFEMSDLELQEDEVLAVVCSLRLNVFSDSQVLRCNPVNKFLKMFRMLKPRVFVLSEINASLSGPFFLDRFKKTLTAYSTVFECCDAMWPRDSVTRQVIEQVIFARDIMNIIAYEGLDRTVRQENFETWYMRMLEAGFANQPLSPAVMGNLQQKMQKFPNWSIRSARGGALLLHGQTSLMASSAWRPAF